MVTGVDDIVEELTPLGGAGTPSPPVSPAVRVHPPSPPSPAPKARSRPRAALPEVRLSLEEASLLGAIPEGGTTVDALARGVGMGAAHANAVLVGLRLKGRIRFLPGNRVATAQKI